MRGIGYQKLWNWFGMSRCSFLTLPRAMMHDMPEEWQSRMADLLEEWDEEYSNFPLDWEFSATIRKDGKLVKMPERLMSYRHNKMGEFDDYRNRK